MEALLDRIALALEESNAIARQAQKDWREARTEGRSNHKIAMQSSQKLHALLEGQARRNAQRDDLLSKELARLAERDAEQTRILTEVHERQTEQHELAMANMGARAPETVPREWEDDGA
jgi:hypothetical protein